MKELITSFVLSVTALFSGMTAYIGDILVPPIQEPIYVSFNKEATLGADTKLFVGGTTYALSGSGISSSATSIGLTSLTIPQTGYELLDADFSDTFYVTIEPGNTSRQEFASCTTVAQNADNTATLSGCTRGLRPFSPYTANSSYQFAHAGGTKLIFSNPPQLYDEAAFKGNDEAVTGVWTFNSNLPTSTLTATGTTQFATKGLVDAMANQGAATATESVTGISRLATEVQVASSTASTANLPYVIQAQNATSTPTYGCNDTATSGSLCIPVAENDGKLNQGWLDLTEAYTWSGTQTFSGTTAVTGTLESNLSTNDFVIDAAINGSVTPQVVAVATTTTYVVAADANNTTAVQAFGFITTNATASSTPYITIRGIVGGFSGLTVGANYYVSDTAGSIATTPSTTTIIPVGVALSATKLYANFGKKIQTGTITHSSAAAGTQDVQTIIGFTPAFVRLLGTVTADDTGESGDGNTRFDANYHGTNLVRSYATDIATGDATTVTISNIGSYTAIVDDLGASSAGGSNANSSTFSLNAVGADSITTRIVNATTLGAGGTSSGTIKYIALE